MWKQQYHTTTTKDGVSNNMSDIKMTSDLRSSQLREPIYAHKLPVYSKCNEICQHSADLKLKKIYRKDAWEGARYLKWSTSLFCSLLPATIAIFSLVCLLLARSNAKCENIPRRNRRCPGTTLPGTRHFMFGAFFPAWLSSWIPTINQKRGAHAEIFGWFSCEHISPSRIQQ